MVGVNLDIVKRVCLNVGVIQKGVVKMRVLCTWELYIVFSFFLFGWL